MQQQVYSLFTSLQTRGIDVQMSSIIMSLDLYNYSTLAAISSMLSLSIPDARVHECAYQLCMY